MGRTEKRPFGWGGIWRGIRDLALYTFPALSALLTALLVLADHSRSAALVAAPLFLLAGLVQRIRARHRLVNPEYRAMTREILIEVGFARLSVCMGLVLSLPAYLLPPPLSAIAGFLAATVLLIKGIGTAGASADRELELGLWKPTAAEECWRVQKWAKRAAQASLIPGARCFDRIANYEVAPGQIGIPQSLSLLALLVAMVAYGSLALALGISYMAGSKVNQRNADRGDSVQSAPGSLSPVPSTDALEAVDNPPPTYAELCPAEPDPLDIDHGLGSLFQRDGAVKAGCGTRAAPVDGTGAWIAAGICSGEMRSAAVSAPGYQPAMLYGASARFAWSAAQNKKLVAAEVAEPGEGDVDLVRTTAGTYGFTRPTPSVSPGREDAERCTEVSGVARPFAKLPPPMVLLWLQLIRRRAAWSWPVSRAGTDDLAFTSYPSGALTAEGSCRTISLCYLDADGERWLGRGTGFVSLRDFEPYMPESAAAR